MADKINNKRKLKYTKEDKYVLLRLINRYKSIIENKEINARMCIKKRETWEVICQQYNVIAASGDRTWLQLRNLYENLKQRSKKSIAKDNHLQFYEKTKQIQTNEIETNEIQTKEIQTKQIQKNTSSYKKHIKRGRNFAPEDRDLLLGIIKTYENIIENKEYNASMHHKKRVIWNLVCQQYNAAAVSGCRTWQQLRHLYENYKQRSKKSIAKDNNLKFYEKTKEIQTNEIQTKEIQTKEIQTQEIQTKEIQTQEIQTKQIQNNTSLYNKKQVKRGPNYTPQDKDMLLGLIKIYENIIENKETNAHMIHKKRETWKSVCQQYNTVAVSGCRTWQQLRHLYENLKQRSKKSIAKDNLLQFYENSEEISKTDGQILAMAFPPKTMLPNDYEDPLYLDDTEEIIEDDVLFKVEILDHDYTKAIEANKPPEVNEAQTSTSTSVSSDDTEEIIEDDALFEIEILDHGNTKAIEANKPPVVNEAQTSTSTSVSNDDTEEIIEDDALFEIEILDHDNMKAIEANKPVVNEAQASSSVSSGKIKQTATRSKDCTCNNFRLQYFKRKSKNALLEKMYLDKKNKREMNIYKLQMRILRLKLREIKSRRRWSMTVDQT